MFTARHWIHYFTYKLLRYTLSALNYLYFTRWRYTSLLVQSFCIVDCFFTYRPQLLKIDLVFVNQKLYLIQHTPKQIQFSKTANVSKQMNALIHLL